MKILKLVLGVIAAFWTLGVAIGVGKEIGVHGGTRGFVDLIGGGAIVVACAAITLWLFQSALRKR